MLHIPNKYNSEDIKAWDTWLWSVSWIPIGRSVEEVAVGAFQSNLSVSHTAGPAALGQYSLHQKGEPEGQLVTTAAKLYQEISLTQPKLDCWLYFTTFPRIRRLSHCFPSMLVLL